MPILAAASVGASVSQASALKFMSEAGFGSAAPARSKELLSRIASALGVPSEAFLCSSAIEIKAHETWEMLELWRGLESFAARQKLLHFARALSSNEHPE